MADFDIKCIFGCNTVLGQVQNRESYPGDAYFGLACVPCASRRADERVVLHASAPSATPPTPLDQIPLAQQATVAVKMLMKGGSLDGHNGQSVVQVEVDPGNSTATGITLNGASSPCSVTLASGAANIAVGVSGAGTVALRIASVTHPNGLDIDKSARLILGFVA